MLLVAAAKVCCIPNMLTYVVTIYINYLHRCSINEIVCALYHDVIVRRVPL